MNWTPEHLTALDNAIATGARKVKFGYGPDAQEVEYRDLEDMLRTRAIIVAALSPSDAPRQTSYIAHGRD